MSIRVRVHWSVYMYFYVWAWQIVFYVKAVFMLMLHFREKCLTCSKSGPESHGSVQDSRVASNWIARLSHHYHLKLTNQRAANKGWASQISLEYKPWNIGVCGVVISYNWWPAERVNLDSLKSQSWKETIFVDYNQIDCGMICIMPVCKIKSTSFKITPKH